LIIEPKAFSDSHRLVFSHNLKMIVFRFDGRYLALDLGVNLIEGIAGNPADHAGYSTTIA
jgi:hypothetical protein